MNANRLGNGLTLGVGMVLELILHTSTVLDVGREVNTLGERLGGRGVGCLSIGLSIDVFACNAWNVASIA